ncbi:MAG: hypothetical protein KTR19_09270 [Hyphomicrobiales bacterium]|nr:hypothetical protein [Hyphomicrobiales bacterium]
MTLAKFDPWCSLSRPQPRAYRAYRAYHEPDLGTLGTLGTGAPAGETPIGIRQRRQQWLANLAGCRATSAAERRLMAVARQLSSGPWSYRFIELGWTDADIFGIGVAFGHGLLQHLAMRGARLRAVTDETAWIEFAEGCRQRYRRGSLGDRAQLLWESFARGEMEYGH